MNLQDGDHVVVLNQDFTVKYPNMHYLNDYRELGDLISKMTGVNFDKEVYDKTFGNYLNGGWLDHLNYFIRDEHECLVMIDGLGSMANIVLASETELQECSLSKSQASNIVELFK
ncbi:hypothetical protein HK103_004676 [Boothiomyces macroporosus]|uniref:Uncharacterized protein n=1 Tax=Boothiomyces macroporosus TaxID=261099 RepID=A0AAD5ULV3_9FUNG|nr:hypothetical protein HK103_004676 [Boothiomyces macroporosus]